MGVMDKPKISVIVPVYNMGNYLDETIESWTTQTFSDIELIYIDDCSTDNSLEILEKKAALDDRIIVHSFQENKSAWSARLWGVHNSSGDYIMFADADDTVVSDTCEKLYAHMMTAPVDILQFGTNLIDVNGSPEKTIAFVEEFLTPYERLLKGKEVFEACFRDRKYSYNLWNKIYSAKVCRAAFEGQKEEKLPRGQDKLAYFLIAFYAKSYRGIKDKYYNYYFGRGGYGTSLMGLNRFEQLCSMSRVADKMQEFLNVQDLGADYSEVARNFRNELISDCVSKWNENISDGEKAKAFDMLMSHWHKDEVISAFASLIRGETFQVAYKIKGADAIKYVPRKIKTIGTYYHSVANGGVERVLSSLLGLWTEMGYEVILITDYAPSDDEYDIPSSVRRLLVPDYRETNYDNYAERSAVFERIVKDNSIDLLVYHAWDMTLMFWDELSVKAAGAAFVAHCHSVFSYHMFATYRQMSNLIAPYILADSVVSLSKADREFWSYYNPNVTNVINPFTGNRTDWEQSECNNHDVLWLARFSEEKSPFDALEIMTHVLKAVPDAKLHMVGSSRDQHYYNMVVNRVKELGLRKSVVLHGFHKDVISFYRESSVFLMTSKYEGYPLALQESMMAGLPVVMYELPYLTAVQGNQGISAVPQGDVRQAARQIIDLLQNDEKRKHQGNMAHRYYEKLQEYDFQDTWRGIIDGVNEKHPDCRSVDGHIMMDTLIIHHDWGTNRRQSTGFYENMEYLDRKIVKTGILAAKTIDFYREKGLVETVKKIKKRAMGRLGNRH